MADKSRGQEIADVVQAALYKKDRSAAWLEDATKLSRSTIDRILAGKAQRPNRATLATIYEALDVPVASRVGVLS